MIKPFSSSLSSMEQFKDKIEIEIAFAASSPFPKEELTGKASRLRISKSLKSFAFFDRTYFPPECYGDQYAEPNKMVKDIIGLQKQSGIHIIFGPRSHGKTVTGKKLLIWLLLTGRIKIGGTYAETLNPKSYNILADVSNILQNNDRIKYDFNPIFQEDNADQIQFKLKLPLALVKEFPALKGFRYCAAFSQGRSVRGYAKLFGRPEFLLGDDVETLESSFNKEANQLRIDKLAEAFHSMMSNSLFLIMANDFTTASALHNVRVQIRENLFSTDLFHVHIYQAWETSKQKPLWHQKFNVESEKELKAILKPMSESDWQANFQSNPVPPEGLYFRREFYQEYTHLPQDARGVIYCDPNLSKKGLGDTTAIVPLLFSAKTMCYYIPMAICRSFSDSNKLLEAILNVKRIFDQKIISIGFDGHVSQESTWTQLVRNFIQINNIPFPVIEYKGYKVDDLAKNIQVAYNEMKIYFPPGFARTPEGETFLNQLFSFAGKKANKKDDAPDATICAFEYLHERSLTRTFDQPVKIVKDYYSLF